MCNRTLRVLRDAERRKQHSTQSVERGVMEELKFDERGLITAVVQDAQTLQVLMVAWMNADALRLTQETGEAHFWSRSRQELWHKGGTSGNIQRVRELRYDCDGDTLLLLVDPAGPACHTGNQTCFFRKLNDK